MLEAIRLPPVRGGLRGIVSTLALVALVSAGVFILVDRGSLTHGSVIYIFPVVIAATRWGLACSLLAAIAGTLASAYFFYAPIYSFRISDPHEFLNLALFIFVAVVTSHLAARLMKQAEVSRQREIDMRDLYAFSRRLAVAFDVSDIHSAIEDHLAAVLQRKVMLFANARDAFAGTGRRAGLIVPEPVRHKVVEVAGGRGDPAGTIAVNGNGEEIWLVRAVSSKSPEFGVIAINLGHATQDDADDLRVRVDAVLADATATLERLGVAHAISEARMRSRSDQLREALIGSVSHELRTPLASIMGAATVLGAAPALAHETKLRQLVYDVRDEAERLNNDIQNLLDASRISSDSINPHIEWADPADIIHSAIERSRRRMDNHRLILDLPANLPLVHVDPVLIQQAMIQIFDNAVKYSRSGSPITVAAHTGGGRLTIRVSDEGTGITADEKSGIWDRFSRGERHVATISGSGLGLWIANAFVAANGGTIEAASAGAGHGATLTIELPVEQVTVSQMEGDSDE
jgi:two-component system sensor histidine kinase KdpD